MNDAGSSNPGHGAGPGQDPDRADAEVITPPAGPAGQASAEPAPAAGAGDGAPDEPPEPLDGYEHV